MHALDSIFMHVVSALCICQSLASQFVLYGLEFTPFSWLVHYKLKKGFVYVCCVCVSRRAPCILVWNKSTSDLSSFPQTLPHLQDSLMPFSNDQTEYNKFSLLYVCMVYVRL